MKEQKVSKDKRYEDRHKEERKAKCMIWGTSVERPLGEEINEFLKKSGYTKVQVIKAGYEALLDEYAQRDLSLAKIMDKYDDFFYDELEAFKKKREDQT